MQGSPAHSPVRALLEWVPQRGPGKYDFLASLLHEVASADVDAADGNTHDAVRAIPTIEHLISQQGIYVLWQPFSITFQFNRKDNGLVFVHLYL